MGCGAGRVSLYLERKGLKVVAFDRSPLAIRLCRKRGVKDARVLPIEQIARFPADSFDTVVMFGNNLGLLGNYEKARRLLRQLYRLTTANAVILGESLNPYETTTAGASPLPAPQSSTRSHGRADTHPDPIPGHQGTLV